MMTGRRHLMSVNGERKKRGEISLENTREDEQRAKGIGDSSLDDMTCRSSYIMVMRLISKSCPSLL